MTRRALLLPGRAYPAELALLAFTRLALEQHGWDVRPVRWTLPEDVTDPGAWVAEQTVAAVAGDPGPWLFAAKSLGTRVVQSGPRAEAYVLLTPLLVEPDLTARVTDLVTDGARVLLVGGTADRFWSADAARSTGAEVLEIRDADHAMYVHGDPVASAEAHVAVTRAVVSFVAGLRW